MKIDELADIDVRDAVAVGQQEVLAADVALDAFDPATGHGLQTSLRKSHMPVLFRKAAVQRQLGGGAKLTAKIAVREMVIEEVAFDRPTLIAQAEHEVLE